MIRKCNAKRIERLKKHFAEKGESLVDKTSEIIEAEGGVDDEEDIWYITHFVIGDEKDLNYERCPNCSWIREKQRHWTRFSDNKFDSYHTVGDVYVCGCSYRDLINIPVKYLDDDEIQRRANLIRTIFTPYQLEQIWKLIKSDTKYTGKDSYIISCRTSNCLKVKEYEDGEKCIEIYNAGPFRREQFPEELNNKLNIELLDEICVPCNIDIFGTIHTYDDDLFRLTLIVLYYWVF